MMAEINTTLILDSLIKLLRMLEANKNAHYLVPYEYISVLYNKETAESIACLKELKDRGSVDVVMLQESNQNGLTPLPQEIAYQEKNGALNIRNLIEELLSSKEFIQCKINDEILQDMKFFQQELIVKMEETIKVNNEFIKEKLLEKLSESILLNKSYIEKLFQTLIYENNQYIQDEFKDVIAQNYMLLQRSMKVETNRMGIQISQCHEKNGDTLPAETISVSEQKNYTLSEKESALQLEPQVPKFSQTNKETSKVQIESTKADSVDMLTEEEKNEQSSQKFPISSTLQKKMNDTTLTFNKLGIITPDIKRLALRDGQDWMMNPRPFESIKSARQFPLLEQQGNASFLGFEGEGMYWFVTPLKSMKLEADVIREHAFEQFFEFVQPDSLQGYFGKVTLVKPAIFEKSSADNLYYLVARGQIEAEF